MPVNTKELIKAIAAPRNPEAHEPDTRPKWNAEEFMHSMNALAIRDANRLKIEIPLLSLPQAEKFLSTGIGIDGNMVDVLERWVEIHTGVTGTSGKSGFIVRAAPETITMRIVTPPTVLPLEFETSDPNPAYADVTNQRALNKFVKEGIYTPK